jgi:hypothetical protein
LAQRSSRGGAGFGSEFESLIRESNFLLDFKGAPELGLYISELD